MADPPVHDRGDEEVTLLARFGAPWGKEIAVEAVRYSSGLRLARLRIREGRRFTVLDVDRPTADRLTAALVRALHDDA